MKTSASTSLTPSGHCLLRPILRGLMAAVSLLAFSAHAGLTFTVDLYVSQGNYVFYTPLDTNSASPDAAMGTYNVFSPDYPAGGSWREIVYDANGTDTIGGIQNGYADLASVLDQITNGVWTLQFSNAVTTNTYHFTVSLPGGLSSNQLPATLITSPANLVGITNMPAFTWQGQPTNWQVNGLIEIFQFAPSGNENFFYFDPNPVSLTQSNFIAPCPIPADGSNDTTYFNVDYATNYSGTLFVASAPVDVASSQPLAAWEYNSRLESGAQIGFTVAAPPSSSTNHTLLAHYAFDGSDLGADSSGNNFNLECGSGWGAGLQQQPTADAVAGGGAVQFFGDSSITPCGPPDPAFVAWTNAFFGSFTVSAWIKTTNVVGGNTDNLQDFDGQNVIYVNNSENGLIPLGITGTAAAIATGVPDVADGRNTLNSSASVVTGSYVFVAVTRDQGSGLRQIYINGVLDSWGYGEPGILDGGADYASIGGESSGPYVGNLDDVQIYSGVLSAAEIGYLYRSPGSTAPNAGLDFNTALQTTNLTWTTSGDTTWFIESTNTYGFEPYAAASGMVTNEQSSTLTVTMNGPASLTFYWSAQGSEFSDFDYEVYLDGDPYNHDLDDLYVATPWTQDGPFKVPSGQHTVSWSTFAYGDDDPTEVGFLDHVVTTPISAQLQNPAIVNGQFQFQFSGTAGFNYNIYSTTNLASGNRTFLGAYQGGLTYNLQFPISGVQQFYTARPQ